MAVVHKRPKKFYIFYCPLDGEQFTKHYALDGSLFFSRGNFFTAPFSRSSTFSFVVWYSSIEKLRIDFSPWMGYDCFQGRKSDLKMNTRKIMGAVGALVCAINFFTTTPVGAVASVEKQEAHAQKLSMPLSTSKEALALEPVLNVIEKRICDTNGFTVTSQRFQNNHDFETKLHPVQMVDYVGSFATGAGYIYVGVENVTKVYNSTFPT